MIKRIINGLEVEGTEKEWAAFDKAIKEKEKIKKYRLSTDSFATVCDEETDYFNKPPRCSG